MGNRNAFTIPMKRVKWKVGILQKNLINIFNKYLTYNFTDFINF